MAFAAEPGLSGSRQDQFLRYFRNTRLSDAFQKAMITLHKMPVKPANITEFFAEYFDNGAKSLIHTSLLKAELCYKLSEKEELRERISSIENQIRKLQHKSVEKAYPGLDFGASDAFLEDAAFATISGFPDERDAMPEDMDDEAAANDETFLIDRFLGDVRTTLTLETLKRPSAMPEETRGEDDENTLLNGEDNEGQEEQEELEDMHEEEEMIELDPEQEWKVMMSMLDPWGILINKKDIRHPSLDEAQLSKHHYNQNQPTGTPPPTENFSESFKLNEESQHTMETDEVLSQITSALSTEYESDDAATLAETYYNFATSVEHKLRTTRIFDGWDEEDKVEEEEFGMTEIGGRRYTTAVHIPKKSNKKSSDKTGPKTFEELMGWTSLPCTTTGEMALSKEAQKKSETLLYPKPNWSQFTELYKDMERGGEDEDDGDSCNMDMDFYRDVLWQDEAMNLFPANVIDESFLLQCEKEGGEQGEEEGFVFNLCKNFDQLEQKDREAICGKCKKKKKKPKTDGQTSTTELGAEAEPCVCEDCECDPNCGPPPGQGREKKASLEYQGSSEDVSEAWAGQSTQDVDEEMEGEDANNDPNSDKNAKKSSQDAENKNNRKSLARDWDKDLESDANDDPEDRKNSKKKSNDPDRKTSPPVQQRDDKDGKGKRSSQGAKAKSGGSGKMVEMTDSFKEFLEYMAKEGKSLTPLDRSSDQCQCDHEDRTPPSSPLFQEECDAYCQTRKSGEQAEGRRSRRATLDAELEESFKRTGFPAKMGEGEEPEAEAEGKKKGAYVPIDGSKVKKDVYYYFADRNFDATIRKTFFGEKEEDKGGENPAPINPKAQPVAQVRRPFKIK